MRLVFSYFLSLFLCVTIAPRPQRAKFSALASTNATTKKINKYQIVVRLPNFLALTDCGLPFYVTFSFFFCGCISVDSISLLLCKIDRFFSSRKFSTPHLWSRAFTKKERILFYAFFFCCSKAEQSRVERAFKFHGSFLVFVCTKCKPYL